MINRKLYSKEFKEQVVNYYFEHEGLGYLSVARTFDIPSDETVRAWVKKKEADGDQAFDPKPRGRNSEKFKKKGKIKKKTGPISTDEWENPEDSAERIAFLEAENAYLKKLLMLRKEERD